jgi:hypothetical protein
MPTLLIEGTEGQLAHFRWVWLKYVTGFKANTHCKNCLYGGEYGIGLTEPSALNEPITLRPHGTYDYIYLCGMPKRQKAPGVHFAARPTVGAVAMLEADNGLRFMMSDMERLNIPKLPEGFNGLPHAYWSCVNYQFGVAYYGKEGRLPPRMRTR